MGSLADTPVPVLLVGLHRDGFEGRLTLRRGRVSKRFDWRAGRPVGVASDLPAERLTKILGAERPLPRDAEARVAETITARGCSELQALASLGLTSPRTVVLALGEQLRRSLTDCLTWREGEFELAPTAGANAAPTLPFDLLRTVCEAVASDWAPHEVLTALGRHALLYPTLVPDFEIPWLEDPEQRLRLSAALDGERTTFHVVQALDDPRATASLWLLDALGALIHREAPALPAASAPDPAPTEPKTEAEPEFEIVVSGRDDASSTPSQRKAARPERVAAKAAAETLRREVEALHGELSSLSLWQVLGLEPGADVRAVRRAYLKAAKRLHPDRIVQLGLADLKDAANELFAEITRAHTVLSDPEARQRYEENADAPATDADRIAEAEASFRRGDVLLRAGNFRGALELLERAVSLWPEEAEYQAALGWALHRKTPPDSGRAWSHFERALALGEKAVWLLRASLVARELGNDARAEELATRARALDPNVKA